MAVLVNLRSSFQDEVKSAARNGCATKPQNRRGGYKSKFQEQGGQAPTLRAASRACAVAGLADVDFEAADPAGDEIVNRCSDCCSDAADDAVADRKNND